MPLPELVEYAFQQNSSTVVWWYQCRNIKGFLRRMMKTVSISSKSFEKFMSMTQAPTGPYAQVSSLEVQMVSSKDFDRSSEIR